MQKIHVVVHLERKCRKCNKNISTRVHDYGPASNFNELDERMGEVDFPVIPLECPKCGSIENPEDIVTYNISSGKMVQMTRSVIGTPGMPVVGGEGLPYGVTISPEEQAEYDRGLAKISDHYSQHKAEFWDGFCSYAIAIEQWRELLKEITIKEYIHGYELLNLSCLPGSASVAAWRKDAENKFKTVEERRQFWKTINEYLVENEFVWVPIDTWPMRKWVSTYGRERVTYLTLHLPLPEELERWRSEKLSLIIKKRSGETGVLFERIGQLGKELDRQRKRASQMGQTIMELRQELSQTQEKLSSKREIAKPMVIDRQADDVRKIRELKGLVAELRAEAERLTDLVPREDIPREPEKVVIQQLEVVVHEVDLSVLSGKTILVVGWPNATIEKEYRVIWHDGDKVDMKLQAMAKEADILVFLTRFGAHSTMWWLKEAAIDMNKSIFFVRERNLDRILSSINYKLQ